MSTLGAKVVDFLIKAVLVLSILATLFFGIASIFEELIPSIAAILGIDPASLPPLAILTGAGAVLSGVSLKVSSVARNITNAQALWEKEQLALQRKYFDEGILKLKNDKATEIELLANRLRDDVEIKNKEIKLRDEELKLQKQKLELEKSKLNKIKSKNYKR